MSFTCSLVIYYPNYTFILSLALGMMKRKEAKEIAFDRDLKLILIDGKSKPFPTYQVRKGREEVGEGGRGSGE